MFVLARVLVSRVAQVTVDSAASRSLAQVEACVQDVRYAIRTLGRSPGFTAAALATLALGIGANAAIFSVVNAVLLKPLAYADPDRIVFFFVTTPRGPSYGGSAAKYNVWRRQTETFENVSAYEYRGSGLNLTGGSYPEQVLAIRVTASYFRLFGVPMAEGRAFTPEEDRPGGGRVAVLSYGLWQRRFAGDARMTGKTISLGGEPYTVVGIAGAGFDAGLDAPPEVWLPFQIDPASADHAQYFTVAGRLRPGVTLAMANARLQAAAGEFGRRFPNIAGPRDGFGVQRLRDGLVSDVRPALLILACAVACVLLIACANVANLLLARAAGRRREIAIRSAVGASRGRIVRQLLTESAALALAGGALGLVPGLAGVRILLALHPGDIPRIGPHGAAIALDWRLLGFTAAVSILTGLVFGLAPALATSRAGLGSALREGGGRSGSSRHGNRTRATLVAAEVGLALVLSIGAGLLIRTFAALRGVNPGFDSHHVLTLRMSLAGSRFRTAYQVNQLVRDGAGRLDSVPGCESSGASYVLPLEGAFGVPFNVIGETSPARRYDGRGWIGVSPGYFDVFKIPILRGRGFNDRDDASAAGVAIVNQTLARQFWPHRDPLGGRIVLGREYGREFEEPVRQIVGVTADVHDSGLDRNPGPIVYVPLAQVTDGITRLAARAAPLVWIVRTKPEPRALGPAIESAIDRATGGLPVSLVRSMDEVVAQSTARASFNMLLMTVFAAAALLLALIGIFGVIAYSVRQRTQEFGIRLALGASTRQVRNGIVLEGMRPAMTGIAVGLVAAFALTRFLSSVVFGIQPRDPLVFTVVPAVLIFVSLPAVCIPAIRAARIDPSRALRWE